MASVPRIFPPALPRPQRRARATGTLLLALVLAAGSLAVQPARAQSESFLLKPGSKVGPASKVKTTNCVTNPSDGSITCDTQVVNPPGDTQAKPQYSPFKP